MSNTNKIFTTSDAYITLTISLPSGKTWTSYTQIKIECWNNDELVQTNGYPADQKEDIQLVVPDTSSGVCYFKLDQANIDGRTGIIEWRVISKESDSDMSDTTLDLEDRMIKLRFVS